MALLIIGHMYAFNESCLENLFFFVSVDEIKTIQKYFPNLVKHIEEIYFLKTWIYMTSCFFAVETIPIFASLHIHVAIFNR